MRGIQIMTETTHQITLSAELESLPKFRDLIKTASQNSGLSQQDIFDMQLAVDEICTNIIMHGYAEMDPGSIILVVEAGSGGLKVSITDFGHPFEPTEPPAPNTEATLEEREVGGLGLFFVFTSVDQLNYESSATGNVTTLVKQKK
jgi:serine/threonine-protein kinase RsbW